MIWDWERFWSVLRWVLLTLAVGFIGQFGRSLALAFLRRRRAKAERGENEKGSIPLEVQMEQARLNAQAKIEKKRAKAQVKRGKRNSED